MYFNNGVQLIKVEVKMDFGFRGWDLVICDWWLLSREKDSNTKHYHLH